MGLRRRIVGSVGRQVGSDPETRRHRKPFGYIAAGLTLIEPLKSNLNWIFWLN